MVCEHKYEARTYNKPFKCDGCKEQGHGLRYRCDNCGRELHKECRFPEQKILHKFSGRSFKFLKKPQRECGIRNCKKEVGRCCDACGKDILGYNYHCKLYGWDLHPCCSKLPQALRIDETIFKIQIQKGDSSSKCISCDQKKVTGGVKHIPGWFYVSDCGEYHFHVYCVMKLLRGDAHRDRNLTLDHVNLHQLAKPRVEGRRKPKYWRIVKLFVKTILSIVLGDYTTMVSHVLVELLTPS